MVEVEFDQKYVVMGGGRVQGPLYKAGEVLVVGMQGRDGPGPSEGVAVGLEEVTVAVVNDSAEQL